MKQQRTIWFITGLVVLAAGTVLIARKLDEQSPEGNDAQTVQTPSETESRLIRNMIHLLTQDPGADEPRTQAAVNGVADLAATGRRVTAETCYALGLCRSRQQAFDEGEAAFREAIELNPDWSWPYNGLGILLADHTKGRTQEAEAAFRTAIRLDPQWSRPHNDLAILLRLAGRLDEAEQAALTALQLDPNNVANRNNYGNLLVARKRLTEAEAEYRKAIELDPDHPKPYYNLACVYSLQNRNAEALPLLAKAIALNQALREEARKDPDLDPLRNDSEFQKLLRLR